MAETVVASMISTTVPGMAAMPALPTISTDVPSSSVVRAPNRAERRAETGENTPIAPPIGSSTRPASTSESPNP